MLAFSAPPTADRVPTGIRSICHNLLAQNGLPWHMPIAFDASKLLLAPYHLGNGQPEASACFHEAPNQGLIPFPYLEGRYTEAPLCDLAMRALLGQHARTRIAMGGVELER
jgi:hypothetical protein